MTNKYSGFTLIEILIALAILAIVAVIATTGLETILRARDHANQQTAALAQVQIAMLIIERDLIQLNNRSITDEEGHTQPGLRCDDVQHLEFTHGGFANPFSDKTRSTLQRTAYILQDQQLTRQSWASLDRVTDTPTTSRILLNQITNLHWYFYDAQQQRYEAWPPPAKKSVVLPQAIEVVFNYQPLGTIRRLIVLPRHVLADNKNDSQQTTNAPSNPR